MTLARTRWSIALTLILWYFPPLLAQCESFEYFVWYDQSSPVQLKVFTAFWQKVGNSALYIQRQWYLSDRSSVPSETDEPHCTLWLESWPGVYRNWSLSRYGWSKKCVIDFVISYQISLCFEGQKSKALPAISWYCIWLMVFGAIWGTWSWKDFLGVVVYPFLYARASRS